MNELELILTDLFNCSRTDLYLNAPSMILREKQFNRLDKIFKEEARHTPIQYILGYAEFMGLRFRVDKSVLIPRPETEILVEAVIRQISDGRYQMADIRILDIGTGSGCIAVALAKFLKNVDIVAVDISEEALVLAKENAKLHNTEKNIRFLQSDIFANEFFTDNIKFDIILSNLPYVPTTEIGIFDKTTFNEPKIALDGGRDGLYFYRRLAKESHEFLKENGFLFLELGYDQCLAVKNIFEAVKEFDVIDVIKDYSNIDRVIIARLK